MAGEHILFLIVSEDLGAWDCGLQKFGLGILWGRVGGGCKRGGGRFLNKTAGCSQDKESLLYLFSSIPFILLI